MHKLCLSMIVKNESHIIHDTVSFREVGEIGGKGIYFAISEFLENNKNCKIKEEFKNNNGLLIIERIF